MAALAAKLILVLAVLQTVGALVLIITGILDRVEAKDRPQYISSPLSFLVMPVWTGSLVSFKQAPSFRMVSFTRSSSLGLSVKPLRLIRAFKFDVVLKLLHQCGCRWLIINLKISDVS